MNVFSELIHSVYDFKSYGLFLKDKKRKTFLFGFLLALIYYLVTVILPFVQFQVSTGGIMRIVDDFLPDFEIRDNRLWVDEAYELEESGIYIYVDTEHEGMDSEEIGQYLRKYDSVLIADANSMVFKGSGKIQYTDFADLDPDMQISKSGLVDMFGPFVSFAIFLVLVMVFLFVEAAFFFGVLVVGLFGMIVSSCMHADLTFGQLYKLGVYTRTTPLIIKAIFSFLPFSPPFYSVMSIGISLGYLAKAIGKMETPELENSPVVFYSDPSMSDDRWKRPEEDQDGWNRPGGSQN